MNVLVTGSSGLIGSALVNSLTAHGHAVTRLHRDQSSKDASYWNPEEDSLRIDDVPELDVVIHLAGDNIADGRWTTVKKARILNSRVRGTTLLTNFLTTSDHKPSVFISGSAVGFYGHRGDDVVDEDSQPGTGFLADVCQQWEEATSPAVQAGIRVVHIRMGMVLSVAGGALKKMLFPFKMGLGGVIGNGKQYMSWVSISDVVEMIHYVMTHDSIRGPVNLVSPNPVRNDQFTKVLGHALRRPTIFPMPALVAHLLFGEMANELLLASTRAMPRKLMDAGYPFRHAELADAFGYLFEKS